MKKVIFLFIGLAFIYNVNGQDQMSARLSEAKSSYSDGELENARYALQQSLAELDVIICREVLNVLPQEIGGLTYNESEDYISGNAMGIVGSSVERSYGTEEKNVKFNLMNNSPMLSMITAFLTNPLFANAADGSQKQIKIAGNKAVLQRNDTEANDSYTIQIPLNESLLTLEFYNFSEQEVIKLAESFNIPGIVEIIN